MVESACDVVVGVDGGHPFGFAAPLPQKADAALKSAAVAASSASQPQPSSVECFEAPGSGVTLHAPAALLPDPTVHLAAALSPATPEPLLVWSSDVPDLPDEDTGCTHENDLDEDSGGCHVDGDGDDSGDSADDRGGWACPEVRSCCAPHTHVGAGTSGARTQHAVGLCGACVRHCV